MTSIFNKNTRDIFKNVIYLCSTSGWLNADRIFIFGWIILVMWLGSVSYSLALCILSNRALVEFTLFCCVSSVSSVIIQRVFSFNAPEKVGKADFIVSWAERIARERERERGGKRERENETCIIEENQSRPKKLKWFSNRWYRRVCVQISVFLSILCSDSSSRLPKSAQYIPHQTPRLSQFPGQTADTSTYWHLFVLPYIYSCMVII